MIPSKRRKAWSSTIQNGHPLLDEGHPSPTAVFAPTASRRQIALLGLSLLCLAAVYAVLAARLSRFHAVWSADSGALLAMAQSQLAGHGPALLAYGNAAVDPAGHIHPLAFFVRRGPRGLFLEFEPLFSSLSALALRAFGFGGLTLLPLFCGLGTALATALTARRLRLAAWPLLPLVLGLATPLLLYSVVFWHHTPLMLAVALAGVFLLRALGRPGGEPDGRAAVLAGATLGVGMWLHELLLLLFVAVFVTLPFPPPSGRRGGLLSGQGWRLAGGLLAGFLPCLLVWALANRLLYGLWGGPHVAGNVASLQGHLSGWQVAVDPPHLGQRVWLQLIGAEGTAPGAPLLAGLLGLVVLAGWLTRRWPGAAPWLAGGACLTVAVYGLSLLPTGVPFSGLFAATPLLLPALLPAALRRDPDSPPAGETSIETSSEAFVASTGRACLVFALLVLLNPVQPGMDWGSRYLLTVLPWLFLRSLCAWRLVWQEARGRGRLAAGLVLASLTLLSLSAQLRGLAAVRQDLAFSRDLMDTARRAPGPLLVTDLDWLGPELTASPTPLPERFLVRSGDDRRLLLGTLDSRRAHGFTYMGSFEGLDLLARAAAHADPPLTVSRLWEGTGLRLARFVPAPGAVPVQRASASHGVAPRVLAMYYPWYATPPVSGHWSHQEGVDAAHKRMSSHTHYPRAGPYDSADPAVIERHLTEARAAGLDTLVCSWWGLGDPTDTVLRRLLRRAPAHGLTACAYWERPAHPGDPDATEDELAALLRAVGHAPGYLKVDGKPVVFLYAQTCRSLTRAQWASVLQDVDRRFPPGVLAIGGGATADLAAEGTNGEGTWADDLLLWDGWHTLDTPAHLAGPAGVSSPASAARAQAALFAAPIPRARRLRCLSVETVVPGFDDHGPSRSAGRAPGPRLDRQKGALYQALWAQAIRDRPDWVLVDSFNEWHNGTEIEPSVEEGDRYLALTRREADRFRAASVRHRRWTPPPAPPRTHARKAGGGT